MTLLADPDARRVHIEKREQWRSDPILFFQEVLGVQDIHEPMTLLAESVRDHRKTAIAGCHDSCKSYTLGALAWWWVICWQPGFVITTSASDRQVRHGLWKSIRDHYHNALIPLGGELAPKAASWNLDHETFILGFATTEDTAGGATRFHGFKAQHRLVIMDEAVLVPRGAWEAIQAGLMGGSHARLVAACNPTDPACEAARCWRPNSNWNTINVSAFDLPNLRENRVVYDYLMTPTQEEDLRVEYGTEHPMYQARVLGKWPDSAITTLISMRDWRAALDRKHGDIRSEPVSIGCDVALEGDDLTVIVVLKGPCIMWVERMAQRRGEEVGDRIAELAQEYGLTTAQGFRISIDSTGGYGEAPENRLRTVHGYNIRGENFQSAPAYNPDDPKLRKYRNRRTELWCDMADWIREEACLSNMKTEWERWFEDDLPGCLVAYMADNRRDLERKKDMKKRLGHSPDHGDALALALAWRARSAVAMPHRVAKALDPDEEEFRREELAANKVRLRPPRRRTFEDHIDAVRDRSR